jgi:citrate lyase subunit beta/citryl-CoA lyase
MARRSPHLRRSWLFLPGAERTVLDAAPQSGADVLIQELEDFTPPGRRDEARALAAGLYEAWRRGGVIAAVRINPLETEGRRDLEEVMRGRPDVVLMSKVSEPSQVAALAAEVERWERAYGIPAGATELVPNIESARGVMQTYAIATAHERVTGVAGSTEDMVADLNALRSREGSELAYVRQRLLVECVAAKIPAIDCPYTFADAEGCEADTRWARRLGYLAKSAVTPAHATILNRVLTPGSQEIAGAQRIIREFEAARARGLDRIDVDGLLVEMPIYQNARRLLERAQALEAG